MVYITTIAPSLAWAMASSVAALSHLGPERRFGGPLALSTVQRVRPSLHGVQDPVGFERIDGLYERQAAIKAKPFAGVAMPLNIEAVGLIQSRRAKEASNSSPRWSGKPSGSVGRSDIGAGRSAENVDGIVELSWLDRRQETRLEKVVDQSLTGRGDAGLLGLATLSRRRMM